MSTKNNPSPERRRARLTPLAFVAGLTLVAGGWSAPNSEAIQATRETPQEAAAKSQTARQTMEGALQKVAEILLSDQVARKDKRVRVQGEIEKNVDFETVARLALAQGWKKFSEAQKPTFIDLFKRHLLLTYWKNADYSSFRGFEVTGDRKEQRRDWTVMSVVKLQGEDDIRIDYRLRQDGAEGDVGGEWHIIDILVEGVSLVANFRSQFQSIVNNSGPEKLIEDLEKKVTEAEAKENAGDQ